VVATPPNRGAAYVVRTDHLSDRLNPLVKLEAERAPG
jgi:hypothetical protein